VLRLARRCSSLSTCVPRAPVWPEGRTASKVPGSYSPTAATAPRYRFQDRKSSPLSVDASSTTYCRSRRLWRNRSCATALRCQTHLVMIHRQAKRGALEPPSRCLGRSGGCPCDGFWHQKAQAYTCSPTSRVRSSPTPIRLSLPPSRGSATPWTSFYSAARARSRRLSIATRSTDSRFSSCRSCSAPALRLPWARVRA
jgi:hypothetical protein